MAFKSIMFPDNEKAINVKDTAPEYFDDLNLDQIIDSILSDKRLEYLRAYYYTPLASGKIIAYRQMILKELNDPDIFNALLNFSEEIRSLESRRTQICKNLFSGAEYRKTFLEKSRLYSAAYDYCTIVKGMYSYLKAKDPESKGLRSFTQALSAYICSGNFIDLERETCRLRSIFSSLRYTLNINQSVITVEKYSGEKEYKDKIERTFQKFNDDDQAIPEIKKSDHGFAEHVEAGILNLVATEIYKDEFSQLDEFCPAFCNFMDPLVLLFAKEIMFYISYSVYMDKFKRQGLAFCIPELKDDKFSFLLKDGIDLALAEKLIRCGMKIVCNDISINQDERIVIITGPNQGGKTTFARMIGQISYLASLGCLIPGLFASLEIPDMIFTHFEKHESVLSLEGKLSDDILRINSILSSANPKSLIIINEFLASTSTEDAVIIGKKILNKISDKKCICLFVTFIYDLYETKENIVSMKASIENENPEKRTYKIVRELPDDKAYALCLANKFGITKDAIIERIK